MMMGKMDFQSVQIGSCMMTGLVLIVQWAVRNQCLCCKMVSE